LSIALLYGIGGKSVKECFPWENLAREETCRNQQGIHKIIRWISNYFIDMDLFDEYYVIKKQSNYSRRVP